MLFRATSDYLRHDLEQLIFNVVLANPIKNLFLKRQNANCKDDQDSHVYEEHNAKTDLRFPLATTRCVDSENQDHNGDDAHDDGDNPDTHGNI